MNFVVKFNVNNNVIMFTRFDVDNNIIMMNEVRFNFNDDVISVNKVILMF